MTDTRFIDELASSSPTPGGGGASALCGALAAALASMVGNLTVGKKKYAEVEDNVRASLARLQDLRSCLVSLVDEDACAFGPLAAAYRMPTDTPEGRAAKEEALQAALTGACEVPLRTMRCCIDVLRECDFMARNGSVMAVSDAGAGAALAKAALQGASLNVYINVKSIADAERAQRYSDEADSLMAEGSGLADEVFDYVLRAL